MEKRPFLSRQLMSEGICQTGHLSRIEVILSKTESGLSLTNDINELTAKAVVCAASVCIAFRYCSLHFCVHRYYRCM